MIPITTQEIEEYRQLKNAKKRIAEIENRFAAQIDYLRRMWAEIFYPREKTNIFTENLEIRGEHVKFDGDGPADSDLELTLENMVSPLDKIAEWTRSKREEDERKERVKAQQKTAREKRNKIEEQVEAYRKRLLRGE